MADKENQVFEGYIELLPQSQITAANVREEFSKCRRIIESARADNDYEQVAHYKQRLAKIENKMTPEQYSIEMDDFSELSECVYHAIKDIVHDQENP
jgi:hypothetical protein